MEDAPWIRLEGLIRAAISTIQSLKPQALNSQDVLKPSDVESVANFPDLKEISHEDAAFWKTLASEDLLVLEEMGLFLASLECSNDVLYSIFLILLSHPALDTNSMLLLTKSTIRGLKVCKRWRCLHLISFELLDLLSKKILNDQSAACTALDLYLELFLGYQHTSELFLQKFETFMCIIKNIGQHLNQVFHEKQVEKLVLTCFGLIHIHRGYEVKGSLLKESMKEMFPSIPTPNAAQVDSRIRECAWIYPHKKISECLPTIEGKWVLDDISLEPHTSPGTSQQNVNSVILKRRSDCFSYEFHARVEQDLNKQAITKSKSNKIELDGFLYQVIPDLAKKHNEGEELSKWQVEGHWSQIYDNGAADPTTSSNSDGRQVLQPWSCRACTFNNEATAKKCGTCGTDAPVMAVTQTRDGLQGSNPAPFSAIFDDKHQFMRLRWSRGEQQGVWLAKKENLTKNFDVKMLCNNQVNQSPRVSVFSTKGNTKNALLLEKPLSLATHNEGTLNVWIFPTQAVGNTSDSATIIQSGEFHLYFQPSSSTLVWEFGHFRLTTQAAVNVLAEICLVWKENTLHLSLDGQERAQMARNEASICDSLDEQLKLRKRYKNNFFFIGASPEIFISPPLTLAHLGNVFHGGIFGLSMWSKAFEPSELSMKNTDPSILGSYPLVGESIRILVDISDGENHACRAEMLLEAHRFNPNVQVVGQFSTTTDLSYEICQGKIPSSYFTTSLGGSLLVSGKSWTKDGVITLESDSQAGSSVWFAEPLLVNSGFDTTFVVDGLTGSSSSTIVAMCKSSYWDMTPCTTEALRLTFNGGLEHASNISSNIHGLFVRIDSDVFHGANLFRIGVFVWVRGHPYRIGSASQIHPNDAASLRIRYEMPAGILRVMISTTSVFECALDMDIALELEKANANVRMGLLLPTSQAPITRQLSKWTFETLSVDENMDGDRPQEGTYIGNIYGLVDGSGKKGNNRQNNAEQQGASICCTRSDTDGSAIQQEAYGCQTCNLIHGAAVCRVCAAICHEGHELVAMGTISVACACQLRTSCKCAPHVSIAEFPQANQPIHTSHWCCNKCTVINATGISSCSVCGNQAPVVNAEKPQQASSTAIVPHSASPAPVQMALPVETEWSCSACTMLNAANATKCSICDTERPSSGPQVMAVSPVNGSNAQGAGAAGLIALYHAAGGDSSTGQPSLNTNPVASGPWTCSACTMGNAASDMTCHMCGTTRVVAAPQPSTIAVPAVPLNLLPPTDVVSVVPAPAQTFSPISSNKSIPFADESKQQDIGSTSTATDSSEHLTLEQRNNLRLLHDFKHTSFIQRHGDTKPNDIAVVWESTAGRMSVTLGKSFVGDLVEGVYLEDDGVVQGLCRLVLDETEGNASGHIWKLVGKYKKHVQTQENAFVLQWKASSLKKCEGKWYRGDGSGDWRLVYSPFTSDYRGLGWPTGVSNSSSSDKATTPIKIGTFPPFYSGLVNMKQNLTNVCYQNSFLQTLFMTQAFRSLILNSAVDNYFPITLTSVMGAGNLDETGAMADEMVGQQVDTCVDFLRCLQELFTNLTISQRPEIATHALQKCLPNNFQSGRQQDTSDFAHFVMDSLTQQLEQRPETQQALKQIFGGRQATILKCKDCGHTSVNKEYFWELLLNMIDLRYTPITNICAVSGSSMDVTTPNGFERLNNDLNKDREGVPYVFLCLKRSPHEEGQAQTPVEGPITDLVIKTALSSEPKPTMPFGYERVEMDLNLGGVSLNKRHVYLFFKRDPDGAPITDLKVIYGNENIPDGFKQIKIDLNQGEQGSAKVFLCYRCDMPLTDLKVVPESGQSGYTLIDYLLNQHVHSTKDTKKQYLAFKAGGNEPCITDLKYVKGEEVNQYTENGWISLGNPTNSQPPVPFPLVPQTSPAAAATATEEVQEESKEEPKQMLDQLMARRGHGNPIYAIDVFRAPRKVPKYNDYEVIDLYPSAYEESQDNAFHVDALIGDWSGEEDTDRSRKALRVNPVDPLKEGEERKPALLVKGRFGDKGQIVGIATPISSAWSTATSSSTTTVSTASGAMSYELKGYWKDSKTKQPQILHVNLRATTNAASETTSSTDAAPSVSFVMNGSVGDGKGKPIAFRASQKSHQVKTKWPISQVFVLRGDERIPPGVEIVKETIGGRTGNVLYQTQATFTLYIGVKREETPIEGFVTDLCVIYGEIDAVPENYICIHTTSSGFSANLNDGNKGVPIFVCYKKEQMDLQTSKKTPIMDVALLSGNETLPPGTTKLQHTPLGMEANLNQGSINTTPLYVCYQRQEVSTIKKPLENILNGEYETSSVALGRISLYVIGQTTQWSAVNGRFGTVLHGHLPGTFQAIAYQEEASDEVVAKSKMTLLGLWQSEEVVTMGALLASSFPFELEVQPPNAKSNSPWTLDGWCSTKEEDGTTATSISSSSSSSSSSSIHPISGGSRWKLMKDDYVRIAFKKDYGTEWKDGHLVSSERVGQHDIASMLSRFVAPRTLGGDNCLSCSQCNKKTESRTHSVIVEPPNHLILTIKRMFYDWKEQKTKKSLHDVSFPSHMSLPALSSDDEQVLYTACSGEREEGEPLTATTQTKEENRNRHYGLYGVLVHSGMTANSGHYFSFCRESSATGLELQDSPFAPWIKFNDTKVETSSWAEMNRVVSNSVSDAVYLLLYKRMEAPVTLTATSTTTSSSVIPATTPSATPKEEDEAMLLAKAMALSMSAAAQKTPKAQDQQTAAAMMDIDEEESTTSAGNNNDSVTVYDVDTAISREIQRKNQEFQEKMEDQSTSSYHRQDLHTLVALRHDLDPFKTLSSF